MSLVLEIEFLTGAYRAAHSPASNTPDWPPQPDRVFSGLVAAWAARGEQSIERLALEWLEAQSAPAIHAGDHTVRTAPDVFVPPNDQRETNTEQVYLKVVPGWRTRQPRRFPVAHLDDPVMAMVWAVDPEPKLLAALDALARDVGYIGHSASLVRCRFLSRSSPVPEHIAAPAARQVYPWSLRRIEAGVSVETGATSHPARRSWAGSCPSGNWYGPGPLDGKRNLPGCARSETGSYWTFYVRSETAAHVRADQARLAAKSQPIEPQWS